METISILNVRYDNVTPEAALERSLSFLGGGIKANIFFLNLDCLQKAHKDSEYVRILNSAPLVLPDGVGLRAATALFGSHMRANCNGTDFSPMLLAECARLGHGVYLLGGRPGVAERAAEALTRQFPGLRITGVRSGYFKDSEAVIEDINRSGAEVLLVGLGAPLQEKWIAGHRERLAPSVCLGVGALLDWVSGYHRRSPKLLRTLCLEWFWRILIEPDRMSKRYLVDDMGFMAYLVCRRIKNAMEPLWSRV